VYPLEKGFAFDPTCHFVLKMNTSEKWGRPTFEEIKKIVTFYGK
jgi:hypothetical protein